MNQRALALRRNAVWHSYHIPGNSNIHTIKRDAVFLSAANSPEHELAKALVCYLIKKHNRAEITPEMSGLLNRLGEVVDFHTKGWCREEGFFITEAALNVSKGDQPVRRDVVHLDTGDAHEIETDKYRGERHGKDVTVWRLYGNVGSRR